MNSRRLLGRLSPATAWPEDRKIQAGTRSGIGWSELVSALAREPDPLVVLLLRVKWGGQVGMRPQLEELACQRMGELFRSRGWRARSPVTIANLFRVVLSETLDGRFCRSCNLRYRESRDDRSPAPCPECGSSDFSRHEFSRRLKARALGVDKKSWSQVWEPRYTELMERFSRLEESALRRLMRRLGVGDDESE